MTDPFRIKFELDTNILPYLVDKSYPSLMDFISILQRSKFVYETTISAFVLYEFIGIRKREHFLRQVFEKSKSVDGEINFSSLLKFKDSYSTPHLDYEEVAEHVGALISREIDFLNESSGILINSQSFHEDILPPIKSLYLNSKISKEDCFVIISSVFPEKIKRENFLCLLTNDAGLKQGFTEKKSENRINICFDTHNLTKPHIEHIGDKNVNEIGLDLTKKQNFNVIKEACCKLIKKMLIFKNDSLYLGETFSNHCSGIDNVICVQMHSNCSATITKPPFLTIIGKNLDFIISTPLRVTSIRDKNANTIEVPFDINLFEEGKFSFMLPEFNNEFEFKGGEKEIIKKIKKAGNLVFLHPDSQ